ncbi:hypothetical protein [Sphingobium sp. WCS2017Hpa-17]|uniref:hypothetical protein n=1 Tax=Sphingobium sp. WCS2017Hpa-17 TaxID=3073638 RepID=UPI00288C1003|nr:hypothetical protein [Sphingobium sp. WCS2017Hpa-17]
MRSSFVVAAALTMACSGHALARPMTLAEQRAVEAAVKQRLKDPESARFRHPKINVPADEAGVFYCGFVNSKNSYGGYAGDAEFAVGFATEIKNGKPDTLANVIEIGDADPASEDSQVMRKLCAQFPNLHS